MDQHVRILALSEHGEMLGGGEHSFMDLMARLDGHGYRPLVLVPKAGEVQTILAERGVSTERLEMPQIRPWSLHRVIPALIRGMGICRKNNIRIIYANGFRACLYGGCIGRILRIPVAWHCRIAARDSRFDPLLYRLCHCIVANSRATAQRFRDGAGKKVKVVYNGLDLAWLQDTRIDAIPGIDTQQINILVLARVSREKRHDLALEAFEKIASDTDRVHLYCVGGEDRYDPQWMAALVQKSRRSKYSERIHWVDAVGDVRPWLRMASLLWLPSDGEPFGRVVVEAMACGVPVMATRGGGVPEIITDDIDGILVPRNDADALAKATNRLLTHEDLRQRLISAGFQRARDFSLEAHVRAMAAVFHDLGGK